MESYSRDVKFMNEPNLFTSSLKQTVATYSFLFILYVFAYRIIRPAGYFPVT